jgi:hypothetical protein
MLAYLMPTAYRDFNTASPRQPFKSGCFVFVNALKWYIYFGLRYEFIIVIIEAILINKFGYEKYFVR